MTGFEIKGRCPGALDPMESGDGLVVRIRAPSMQLSPAQAAALARAALAFGNGGVDLTARGHLQLRGVRAEDHPALIAALAPFGLIDPDAGAEARRNILVTPFRQEGDGAEELAAGLAAALAAGPALPAKFGFAVDCGPAPVFARDPADIRLERAADGGLILRPDGHPLGARVGADAVPAALRLAEWFLASGGAPEGRGRMAAHLARGAPLPEGFDTPPAPAAAPAHPGKVAQGWLLACAFGDLGAGGLSALAETGAHLRLTPWRMVLVETATPPPGFITDPADPLLRVSACTGAPGCPQGRAATRPLARALAAGLPPGRRLHVSGCAKGCAHPGPCDLTLTATGAGFALIRGGRAADPPARLLTEAELLPPDLWDTPDAPQL